jgi:hypothetical protein
MTIYMGGSHSVMKDGWPSAFLERYEGSQPVRNVSVGASSSMMSAYHVIFTCEARSGDTVIWEYPLNDTNHINNKGYEERVQRAWPAGLRTP